MTDMSSYEAIVRAKKQSLYMVPKSSTTWGKVEELVEQLRLDPANANKTDDELDEMARAQVDPVYILAAAYKATGEYSKYSDDELQDYARYVIKARASKRITDHDKLMAKDITQPEDSFWSQFTAEEILGMYYDGVVAIPKEFIEWATAEVNSDTVGIEVDDEAATTSEDISDIGLVEGNTLDQKKKIQKYSIKAEAQEEFMEAESEKLDDKNQQILQEQNDLNQSQADALNKINSYAKELEDIEAKIASGEKLTPTEITKYERLGEILSNQAKTLDAKAKATEADLQLLFEDVSDMDNLIKVSQDMESSLNTLSSNYGAREVAISPKYVKVNDAVFGKMAEYVQTAMSHNISNNAISMSNSLGNITANTVLNQSLNNQLQAVTSDLTENILSVEQFTPVNNNVNPTEENQTEKAQTVSENADENNDTETITSAEAADENSSGDSTVEETPEVDERTAAVMEYLDNSNTKIEDVSIYSDEFKQALNEVSEINRRAFFDNLEFKASFKAKLSEYNKLQGEVKGAEISSEKDIKNLEDKKSQLDSGAEDIIGSVDERITVLDNFSTMYDSGLELNEASKEYGNEAVNAGENYLKETGHFNPMFGFVQNDSAESKLGFETISAGSKLTKEAKKALATLKFSSGMNNSAVKQSDKLSEISSEASADKSQASSSVANEIDKKREELGIDVNNQGGKTNSKAKASSNEPDAGEVEKTGKNANQQSQDAIKEKSAAEKEERKTNSESRKNVATFKKNENQIKKLNKDTDKDIKLSQKLNSEAESLSSELEEIQNAATEAQPEAEEEAIIASPAPRETTEPVAEVVQEPEDITEDGEAILPTVTPARTASRAMNSSAMTGAAAPVSKSMNSTADSSANQSRAEQIQTRLTGIQTQNTAISKRVTKNNKQVQNISNSTKALNKTIKTNMKTQEAKVVTRQKNAEAAEKEDKSTTQTIAGIAKDFGYIKLTGVGLMMTPWTHAIGEVMFNVGMYGEMACYATNTALYAAQGNLMNAAMSLGSAALSYTGAATAAGNAAGKAVAQAAVKQGLKETTVNVAKNIATQAVTVAATGAMEAGKNAMLKEAERNEKKDNKTDDRRRTLMRFERQKMNKLNRSVKRVNKTAKLKG